MDDLADIIRKATTVNGKKLSNRAIAAMIDVAPETINRIMRREGNPDVETIDKLADALKLPRARLRSAANLPRGEAGPYQPPEESRLLDSRQRAALDELIRSFVASSPAAPPAPAPVSVLPVRSALDEAPQLQAVARKTPQGLVKDAAGHGDAGEENQMLGAPSAEDVSQDRVE
jgi:transcriptional regulator with XRE-family HTH domain